ncbi:MAG: hypothetical protein KAI47_19705, partial [Deltaproteobacteria bacterium]|nr:hypothetical protein [Deltaproteobacteria bacterium]
MFTFSMPLLFVGCTEPSPSAPPSKATISRATKGISVTATQSQTIRPFVKHGEKAISVRQVKLRHINRTILRAKVLDTATG